MDEVKEKHDQHEVVETTKRAVVDKNERRREHKTPSKKGWWTTGIMVRAAEREANVKSTYGRMLALW